MMNVMKKIVKVEYGNTQIDGSVEFDANTILIYAIVSIISTIYYYKDFVNVYVNDNPVMFFNKNFDSKIKIDLLEELITNACNKELFDETMNNHIKETGKLFNTETKAIKDEVPIYRTAEHGTNIDCKGEVPDTKCKTSDNTPSKSDKYYKSGPTGPTSDHPCAPRVDISKCSIGRVADIDSLSGTDGDLVR